MIAQVIAHDVQYFAFCFKSASEASSSAAPWSRIRKPGRHFLPALDGWHNRAAVTAPMPLARIVARLAEHAHILAEELRARGFEVQTCSPEEQSSEPADLEISLEDCAIEDALADAAHTPLTQDAWVFIAPGAVSENSRPIRAERLIPGMLAAAPAMEVKTEPALQADAFAITFPAAISMPQQEIHSELGAQAHDASGNSEPVTKRAEPISSVLLHDSLAAERQLVEQPQRVVVETHVVATVSTEPGKLNPPVSLEIPAAVRRRFPSYRVRIPRMSRNEKLFWKIASLAAMLTFVFLLLTAASHHFSPVPAGLGPGAGEAGQPVPFAKARSDIPKVAQTQTVLAAEPGMTAPPSKDSAASQVKLGAVISSPRAVTKDESNTGNGKVSLASSTERIAAPATGQDSVARSDADYVARDTIVRYGAAARSAAARRQHSGSRETDYVAKDTVTRYNAGSKGTATSRK